MPMFRMLTERLLLVLLGCAITLALAERFKPRQPQMVVELRSSELQPMAVEMPVGGAAVSAAPYQTCDPSRVPVFYIRKHTKRIA
jgi:hypothetical protein